MRWGNERRHLRVPASQRLPLKTITRPPEHFPLDNFFLLMLYIDSHCNQKLSCKTPINFIKYLFLGLKNDKKVGLFWISMSTGPSLSIVCNESTKSSWAKAKYYWRVSLQVIFWQGCLGTWVSSVMGWRKHWLWLLIYHMQQVQAKSSLWNQVRGHPYSTVSQDCLFQKRHNPNNIISDNLLRFLGLHWLHFNDNSIWYFPANSKALSKHLKGHWDPRPTPFWVGTASDRFLSHQGTLFAAVKSV